MSVNNPLSSSAGSAQAMPIGRTTKEEAKATEEGHAVSVGQPLKNAEGASVLVSFIVLANNILGSGMLGLPYAFSNTGWYLGSFLIIAAGTSSAFALHFLSECAIKRKLPSSFYSVAEACLPRFTLLIDAAVTIKCFGVATSYLIVVGDTMPAVMNFLGASEAMQSRNLWITVFWLCFAVPLSCLRTLEKLKFTAFLSICFVFFLAVLVVAFSFHMYASHELNPCEAVLLGEECKGPTADVLLDWETGKVFPIFVFGFTCQQNIFSIVNEIEDPRIERVNKVITGSIGTAICTYLAVAACGYATYGSLVESDVLLNYPRNELTTVARCFVALLVVFTFPLQCHPARKCVMSILDVVYNNKQGSSKAAPGFGGGLVAGDPSLEYTSIMEPETEADYSALDFDSDSGQGGQGEPDSNSERDDNPIPGKFNAGNRKLGLSSSAAGSSGSGGAGAGTLNALVASFWEFVGPLTVANRRWWMITGVFLLSAFAVASVVKKLGVVLALVGATGSTTVSYILPGFCYYYTFPPHDLDGRPLWKTYAALAQGCLGLLIVPFCLTFIFF